VGHLLGLNAQQMQHAFGSAGTQSAGLWEFLRTAADSKQLHTAHAAGAGLMAAYLAKDNFTGAAQILEGPQGMAAGMSSDADVGKLTDGLGARWATAETSFKYHACCRHTHPAADALLKVMQDNQLHVADLARVITHVHQGAIDVLGPVTQPSTVHQSKFSMGTVLALVAQYEHAGLSEFDQHFKDDITQTLCNKVEMVLDPEVDSAYPQRWIGKVSVYTTDGRVLFGRVDEPKGDPGNTLSRDEITAKALRLAAHSGGATPGEMAHAVAQLWLVMDWPRVNSILSPA
jgi:2-methylcitrate dehydratase PrpD